MRFPRRKPMKQWIKEKLDSKSYPGLRWIDKRRGKFEILWKHGSLQDWCWEDDVEVFREWAIYTGKYQRHNKTVTEDDLELAKKWKTNFRCALNALPGLEKIKEESLSRGANARKVYIMKPYKRKEKAEKHREQWEEGNEDKFLPFTEIEQQDLDGIEEELPPSLKICKKGDNMSTIQDLIDTGEIFSDLKELKW